jgi:hypothetical protein
MGFAIQQIAKIKPSTSIRQTTIDNCAHQSILHSTQFVSSQATSDDHLHKAFVS